MTSSTLAPPELSGAAPEPARVSAWLAALGGIVAGLFGLAVGEIVAGSQRELRSPAIGVGDRVIDHVPRSIKDWAIQTFGTSDKQALLVGILVTLAVIGAAVGIVTLRHRRLGVGAGVAAVVAGVGAVAGVASPALGLEGARPSLAAGIATVAALAVLHRATSATSPSTRTRPAAAPAADRRWFIGALGAVAISALVLDRIGSSLRRNLSVERIRSAFSVPPAARPLPAPIRGLDGEVQGVTAAFTPNAEFYRIDTALTVPAVDIESWRLRIHGMVERELELTFDQLLDRPLIETDVTLSCVSNEVGGDLIGNARWLGIRLDDLLAEAGLDPDADQIVGRSVDGFTAGFPVATLDGRDAIVAIAMNGEALPVPHGYPARLVVPGLYGYVSATKWLREIEITRFDRFEGYWVPRGWSADAPIKTQSRIDTPSDRSDLVAGTIPIAGVAWAGIRGISRVEIRVDDEPWQEARLGTEIATTSWRQWWLPWEAPPGDHILSVRATDGAGGLQTEDLAPPAPDGATGWHTIEMTVAP